jgi:L-serine dehydratase
LDVDSVAARVARIRESLQLQLHGVRPVPFSERNDLLFHRTESLPEHPNGLRFIALDSTGTELLRKTYFSVGGGFVVGADRAMSEPRPDLDPVGAQRPPFPYESGDDLLAFAAASGLSMSEMTLRNEACWRPEPATRAALLAVWNAMQACVTRGCQHEGVLPGGL